MADKRTTEQIAEAAAKNFASSSRQRGTQDQARIQKARNFKGNVNQLKDLFVAAITTAKAELKKANIDETPDKLIPAYFNADSKKTVNDIVDQYRLTSDPLKGVDSSSLGITYAQRQDLQKQWFKFQQELIREKFARVLKGQYLTSRNLPSVLRELDVSEDAIKLIKPGDFSRIRDLLAIDNLDHAAHLNEIGDHGIKALYYIHQMVTSDTMNPQADPSQYLTYTQVFGKPTNEILRKGFPSLQPSFRMGWNAVDKEAVAMVIAPELHTTRWPNPYARLPDALSTSSTLEVNLTTNSSGAVGVYVWNQSLYGSGAGTAGNPAYVMIMNDSTFNPQTGGQAVGPSYIAGPLSPNALQMTYHQSFATACQFESTLSDDQNSGTLYCINFTRAYNQTFFTVPNMGTINVPGTTIAEMGNRPTYQSGNLKTSYRSAIMPSPSIESGNSLVANSVFFSGFYFVIAGAPASTTIGKLSINYTDEFLPINTAAPMMSLALPPASLATESFLTNLLRLFPSIPNWDLPTAEAFIEKLRSIDSTDHDILLSELNKLSNNR